MRSSSSSAARRPRHLEPRPVDVPRQPSPARPTPQRAEAQPSPSPKAPHPGDRFDGPPSARGADAPHTHPHRADAPHSHPHGAGAPHTHPDGADAAHSHPHGAGRPDGAGPRHGPPHTADGPAAGVRAPDAEQGAQGGVVGTGGPHFANGAAVEAEGDALIARHRRVDGSIDVARVADELAAFATNGTHSRAEKGLYLKAAIDRVHRAGDLAGASALADRFVFAVGARGLEGLSRSGAEALDRAFNAHPPEDGFSTALVRADLDRRGQPQQLITADGVVIYGDGADPRAMAFAAAHMEELASRMPPQTRARLAGMTVVLVPRGENVTDSELEFTAVGAHGAAFNGSTFDVGAAGTAAPRVAILQEESLLRNSPVTGRPDPGLIDHEVGHTLDFDVIRALRPDDPRLLALFDHVGANLSAEQAAALREEAANLPDAASVLQRAFELRNQRGNVISDYAGTNDMEWLAETITAFVAHPGAVDPARGAQRLYDFDPALYELVRSVFGHSPQPVRAWREET